MTSAGMAARRAAAAAVLADFQRWGDGEIVAGDWRSWADRLAAELRSLLGQMDRDQSHRAWIAHQEIAATYQQPAPAADTRRLAAIRAVFDVFDWETDDRQYALEQIEEIVRGMDQ
jgi:hypothetical protein